MPNLDLVGQCPIEIDHKYAITVTDFSVKVGVPTIVKKGAFGTIGKAQGVPDVTGSFKLAIPKTGPEISLKIGDIQSIMSKPGGVTISYQLGARKFAILGCNASEKDITVNQGAGTVEVSINYTGTEEVLLA